MASYLHGIYGSESATDMPVSNVATAGIQAVVGTAPVNLLDDPEAAVGVPILLSGLTGVKNSLGYSKYLDKFTIMQSVHATFEIFSTAPIVAINVLDPSKHATEATAPIQGNLQNGKITIPDIGVLLATIVVQSEDLSVTYQPGVDYTASFQDDETVVIAQVAASKTLTATSGVHITYSVLDPSKVTNADIVAGIKLIDWVFPTLGVVPEILLAPGYSQNADVSAALESAAEQVSSVFEAVALVDIDSKTNTTIDQAIDAKAANSLANAQVIVCYPKVTTSGGKTIWMSAQQAALMQATDSTNESTPFVSPSNKDFKISATVLGDAGSTPVSYTLDEANKLNGEGIVTALNFTGWKSWGNNTGLYSFSAEQNGTVFDVKDRYISVKRAFVWQNNGFIRRYFSTIDNPMNFKAIQTLITDENQFYNGFIAAGYVAGMSLTYDQSQNPTDQIMSGMLVFEQSISPYTPVEVIKNTMQFDPTVLAAALAGGGSSD